MRKLAVLFFLSLIVVSCGETEERSVEAVIEEGNLSEIRQKKAELSQEQSELSRKINSLDAALDKLDTDRSRTLVNTQTIFDTVFKHYANVQGDVATDENILIYPETTGVLAEVRVSEGQQVAKGQILAVVDHGGLASELARLETQLQLAETTFERQERLWDQNIGSEMQYLEAKANYEAIQSQVAQVRSQLEKNTVKAPFKGVIDEIFAEQGEVVTQGQNQLFQLINLQNMYVEANVPENYLDQISQGTEVIVEISSIGKEFRGEVRRIGNTINPNNRTFRVEVAIPNENGLVRPNQIATLRINDYTNDNAITVPENAVQQDAEGRNIVYLYNAEDEGSGVAIKTFVDTGYTYEGEIEITEGLEAGETIITDGSRNLRDGQEVRTSN